MSTLPIQLQGGLRKLTNNNSGCGRGASSASIHSSLLHSQTETINPED